MNKGNTRITLKNVNKKVNLGRRPAPARRQTPARLDIATLKD